MLPAGQIKKSYLKNIIIFHSGAGCGGEEGGGREVEGWIEKYFERECSMQSKNYNA